MAAKIFLLIIGIYILFGTIAKPSFFWDGRKALRLRRLFGDGITFVLYMIIGIFCIGFSIASLLGFVSL